MEKKENVVLTTGEKNLEKRFKFLEKVMPIKDPQEKQAVLKLFTYLLSL